jgi:UDP-N-acetylmuramoyl-tripeptide--D-alanyl-D-alanine ligase
MRDFAVYEMGAGKPGDIAYLTEIAPPVVSLVNNIAPAHLERMGSLLGIAGTKGAIYDALPADGVAVVNADDDFAAYFIERVADRRVLRFGLDTAADVQARDIRLDADGARFVLAAPHRATSPSHCRCRAATTCAMRSRPRRWPSRWVPVSTRCAPGWKPCSRSPAAWSRMRCAAARCWSTTATTPTPARWPRPSTRSQTAATKRGWCWATCANSARMKSPACTRLDEQAKAAGIARLFALGELSAHAVAAFGDGAQAFDSHDVLADALAAGLRPGVRVLVKGSRGSAMDRIVKALLQRDAAENGGGTTDAA